MWSQNNFMDSLWRNSEKIIASQACILRKTRIFWYQSDGKMDNWAQCSKAHQISMSRVNNCKTIQQTKSWVSLLSEEISRALSADSQLVGNVAGRLGWSSVLLKRGSVGFVCLEPIHGAMFPQGHKLPWNREMSNGVDMWEESVRLMFCILGQSLGLLSVGREKGDCLGSRIYTETPSK